MIVPVLLNLLPKEWSAVVLSPLSSEAKNFGLIEVLYPDPKDPNKKQKMFAVFHLDDVYDEKGKPYYQEFDLFIPRFHLKRFSELLG